MVIHEKHQNVLQFKETYCDSRDSLDNLCSQIGGDATLYSMFRVEPLNGPVPCPFKGPPFTFSYNRGNGECSSPVSRIDSCTDESRLSFKYQACPDVQGTESTVEELLCVATWKDGSTKYMVGKVHHSRIQKSNQEAFSRGFVYERVVSHDRRIMYHVAQSGDATCNGLPSPLEGSKVMKLTKVDNTHTKCKYPSWITDHHHWHTLDYKKSYHFSHKNATLKITEDVTPGVVANRVNVLRRGWSDDAICFTGNSRSLSVPGTGVKKPNTEMRVVCHSEVKTDSHNFVITAHVTSGCNSGYICLAFYRRDSTVIELQQSTNLVQVSDDACNSDNFNPSKLPFITLITASLHQRKCPHLGRYAVIGQSEEKDAFSRLKREDGRSDPRLRVRRESSTITEREEIKKDCNIDKFESLNIGCSGVSDTMEFESSCGVESNSEYSCYGSWEENGTYYLIASPVSRKSTEARRYCFVSTPIYENHEDGSGETVTDQNRKRSVVKLMLSTVAGSCSRSIQPGITGIKSFNFSLVGECQLGGRLSTPDLS
ncbi:UNVERIFIED_CONTAM: hypothetical protein PYX00_002278 [Menopon gallinae]|uniref:Uncharacterized protein n=1 Tax=Menopon gallinae TaxID=328185 RepID=A0AAW2IHE9_9NEOP